MKATLAHDRILDAQALLSLERWAGAYHMAGYSLECGLKSCVLKHLEDTGIIFKDKKYLDKLSKCWTHDLTILIELANLTAVFGLARQSNPILDGYWGIAKDWEEISRYEQKTKIDAEALIEAITSEPHGVLPWIRARW